MFYDQEPKEHQENYKNMLTIVGRLSRLYSESDAPYISYRAHENIFSKYFNVTNNARKDDSADAYRRPIGIGLKTWVGNDNQKVAEFGKLRPEYEHLKGMELVKAIAEYRNIRIRTTMNMYGLNKMIYHILKRVPNGMCIYEAAFDEIDIENITIDKSKGNDNNTYFSDGKHIYHFSKSKNTLYMLFTDMELLDKFDVEIFDNPYEILSKINSLENNTPITDISSHKIIYDDIVSKDIINTKVAESNSLYTNATRHNKLCLRLYSTKKHQKFVPKSSGLNQWNAGGRTRNADEIYISYPAEDRKRNEGFFPDRNTPFDLQLPNGEWISAKVCQDQGKAIMSNPNRKLGKWLLRDVFELEEHTILTYRMLKEFNIDCVIFTKLENGKYTVDFGTLGTYETFYNIEDEDVEA